MLFDLQGFHSSDSDDQHSDDEEDHVEGMSGDEQMGEQQDFEGSDSFDEVCSVHEIDSALRGHGQGQCFRVYHLKHNMGRMSMMLQGRAVT